MFFDLHFLTFFSILLMEPFLLTVAFRLMFNLNMHQRFLMLGVLLFVSLFNMNLLRLLYQSVEVIPIE